MAPWLGHLMVSRQETARALLTPGEVMQLPPDEAVVMVSGHPPIRATKLRYFRDANFRRRVLAPPVLASGRYADVPVRRPDDWSTLPIPVVPAAQGSTAMDADAVVDDGGLRRQPELADEGVYLSPTHAAIDDSALLDDDDTLPRPSRVDPRLQRNARVAALDPADGIAL